MKTAAPIQMRASDAIPRAATSRKPFFGGPVQRQDDPAQPRLATSRPGDRWEREADRMADHVTGPAPAGGIAREVTPVSSARLRQENGGAGAELAGMSQPKSDPLIGMDPAQADEEPMQAYEELAHTEDDPAQAEEVAVQAQDDDPAQSVATERGGETATDLVATQMAVARGRGDPLAADLQANLGARFGADFQGIRIHTDSAAVQITRALRAHAVARGNDIFFNAGRFAPDTPDGSHLLAHELTHSLQQGAAVPAVDPLQMAEDPVAPEEMIEVRPEILAAIRLARGEEGKVNAKKHGADGKRVGHDRLSAYFNTALGGPLIHPSILERITAVTGPNAKADALPSWCGIFTWWAMKSAGIPVPDWKLGAVPLDALELRGPGELPRKGDIAIDVIPNNHFAMVTGLESAKDAEGKPKKLIRIATINGNTAGEDNLGGQVQQKWHEIGHWDHFLNPVGKLSMPPAPLVKVSRTQTADAEPVESEVAASPEMMADGAAKSVAEVDPLAAELPVIEDAARPIPEADLSLPAPLPPGPPEAVAVVAAADLGTTSEGAVNGYLTASPSVMAVTQPTFATTVSTRLDGEQADLAQNPPVLGVKTPGLDDIPTAAPTQVVLPDTALPEEATNGDPGVIAPVTVEKPAAFTGNADRKQKLKDEDSGSFWDAFTSFLKSFVTGIKTTDPSIVTGAGDAPRMDMSGDADATRMATQRGDAAAKVSGARDGQVDAFKDHPGQANIQPVKVDVEKPVAISAEPGAPLEATEDTGMADYAAAPLPADVRALADSKISTTLAPNLENPKADAEAAATARDTDKEREVSAAETAAEKLSISTDAEERRLVIENRTKVAGLQGEGIAEANKAVKDFGQAATGKETEARGAINTHVKTEQGKADAEITAGETKAKGIKEQGEKDAVAKKAELEKEQEKDSWWDRAKDVIKSAVSVITDAIDVVFTFVRENVAKAIEWAKNAAIGIINAARDWVVSAINDFRDWAQKQVDTYLRDSFPGLADRINGAINTVADGAIGAVNAVADAAIEGVTALADGLSKVLDKILSVFQTALKTAVRVAGAVVTGDFAKALKAAIEGACEIAAVDPKPVFDFFDRAGKAVMTILKDPVTFISNLFSAVGAGMSAFFKNIRQHLIGGVIGWLTGALSEVQLTGPFEFTVSGIISIVTQILGVTYANIKAKVIHAFPPSAPVFDLVEKGFDLVRRLLTEGPMALIDDIVASLSNLKDMVMGAIREWLIVTALKEGVVWLLALTNPASAIVKAVKLIFDLVMFLIERIQQIKDFVLSIYASVAAAVNGNFTAVTKGVEDALARSIPVLISLFASVLGLGNIAKQVKGIIAKVTKPINKVIDAVVKKIVAFAKKVVAKAKVLAGKAKKKAKETVEKIATWWKERRKFKTKDGGDHSIYYKGEAGKADLMIASDPQLISVFLGKKQADPTAKPEDKQVAATAAAKYMIVVNHESEIEKLRLVRSKTPTANKEEYRKASSDVNSEIRKFRNALDDLSLVLQQAKFETEDDALVRTNITWTGNGQKNATALPLTYLSGNTKGSAPGQDPDQWDHAAALDTKEDGSSASTWVRGHLINDNLHGPGIKQNLVPITKDMNGEMEASVEAPAKERISERGKLFFYSAEVTFWDDPSGKVDRFPNVIDVNWGTAKWEGDKKEKAIPDKTLVRKQIKMLTKPPTEVTRYVPSINRGSPTHLERAIKKHGPITGYFITQVLFEEHKKGAFTSETDMKNRLYTDVVTQIIKDKGPAIAKDQGIYVQSTFDAMVKGDVRV